MSKMFIKNSENKSIKLPVFLLLISWDWCPHCGAQMGLVLPADGGGAAAVVPPQAAGLAALPTAH